VAATTGVCRLDLSTMGEPPQTDPVGQESNAGRDQRGVGTAGGTAGVPFSSSVL
jgi:hypothetical protein